MVDKYAPVDKWQKNPRKTAEIPKRSFGSFLCQFHHTIITTTTSMSQSPKNDFSWLFLKFLSQLAWNIEKIAYLCTQKRATLLTL